MSGTALYIDADFEAVRKFIQHVENPLPMFEEIGEEIIAGTLERFPAGEAPDGSAWAPSERAVEKGGKTLIDSALLLQSMTFNASDTQVEVGSNVIYAAIHQFGGDTGRGHKTKLPARPYLGISALDANMIEEVVRDFIEEAAA